MVKNSSRSGVVSQWLKAAFSRAWESILGGFWWPPVLLLAAAILWWSIANRIPQPKAGDLEKLGLYGDSFGVLTSLFTALGFGGLIITLLMQQRQIRMQESAAIIQRKRDEKGHYEDVLFRLLDTYRCTLSEVQASGAKGRDVLRGALQRVDVGLMSEGVNQLPKELRSKLDSGRMTEQDFQRIDYLHYRNFKIVAVEIHPQTRLVDTFEVLLGHMCDGAPNHLLIETYRNLVFAQITFLEFRYFFLVALSHAERSNLRKLLEKSGFLDKVSRSQLHSLHIDMYRDYWGCDLGPRKKVESNPMDAARVRSACRAQRAAGGRVTTTYQPIGTRK